MKTYKLLQLAGLVALLGAATGCADDALVQISPEMDRPAASTGQTITVQASVPGNGSRIAYNEGESRMTMMWEAGDSFSVFNGMEAEKATTFTLESGEGSANGMFTGTPETAYEENDELFIVYPAVPDTMSMQELYLDLSTQKGVLDGTNQYMYAKVTFKNGTLPTFMFNHLTAIAKMNLEFPEGVSDIKQVTLRSYKEISWMPYTSQKTVDFSTGELSVLENGANEYVISGSDMNVVDNLLTVYAYLFHDEKFSVIIATDANGTQYANSFDPKRLQKGKMYRVNAPMIPVVPFNGGEGTETAPYEIANLAQWNSLAALISVNMANEDGLLYSKAHYKMTADIELSETDIMYPLGVGTEDDMYFRGVFDGDNHKISGTLNLRGTNNHYMGLFPVIGWATIRNLHLQATQGDVHDSEYAFGSIVGRMIQGTIENCSSTMDISLSKPGTIGGLVGISIDQMFSSIEGCSYNGRITGTREGAWVGGIIGELGFDGKVRACYTLGSVETTGFAGGIVSLMTGDAQVIGCWSDMQVSASSNFGGIAGKMCDMDTSTEEYMRIAHCYYYDGHVYPVCGLVDGDAYTWADNGRLGDDSMGGVPNDWQIESMNGGLKEYGSLYSFDENGKPSINITSGGSASGENFGSGGEF